MYSEIEFKTRSEAENFRAKFVKEYGYKPKLYEFQDKKGEATSFKIIKPHNLESLNGDNKKKNPLRLLWGLK